MRPLILDVETTTHEKGDPFSTKNVLCLVGYKLCNQENGILKIEYDAEPYGQALKTLQEIMVGHDLIVGANLKFDLHWIRRYGIDFNHCRIWDCQLAEFLLSNQRSPYPSLADMASNRNLGNKFDNIAENYWNKGIDTRDIPLEELSEYLINDIELTNKIYKAQLQELEEQPAKKRLFSLQCQDLVVLEEMEWNGLLLDKEKAEEKSKECEERLEKINEEFSTLIGSDIINPNSGEHLSAVLYGGVAKVKEKEDYLFRYKDGRTTLKTRTVVREYPFPRLVKPLRGTQLKKEGYYATSENVLRQLNPSNKKSRRVIELILEQSKLEKLNGTYYRGLQEKIEEKSWENNYLHGNLNQCVARTGRLSSSDPNLQNVAEEVLECVISRYVG